LISISRVSNELVNVNFNVAPNCPVNPDTTLPVIETDSLILTSTTVPAGEVYWEVEIWQKAQDGIIAASFPFTYNIEGSEISCEIDLTGTAYIEFAPQIVDIKLRNNITLIIPFIFFIFSPLSI